MFMNYGRENFMNYRSYNKKAGWTVIFTMFMVLFLMVLGSSMIYVMRTESQQAHNYVEASVAHYLAEAGIEHAMYVLQNNANDFVTIQLIKAGINYSRQKKNLTSTYLLRMRAIK